MQMRDRERIVPVLLAAGAAPKLGFPQALARFGKKSVLEIALENCAGLARPVVVLGYEAARVRPAVPQGARVVVHRRWRGGQLSSLLAGLRRVPAGSAFMLYPVDYPLLTRRDIRRLARAFRVRRPGQEIVVPVFRGRSGHPVVFSPTVKDELKRARTAKEVVVRDRRRLLLVPVGTAAIWLDFRTPASYRLRLRSFRRRERSTP